MCRGAAVHGALGNQAGLPPVWYPQFIDIFFQLVPSRFANICPRTEAERTAEKAGGAAGHGKTSMSSAARPVVKNTISTRPTQNTAGAAAWRPLQMAPPNHPKAYIQEVWSNRSFGFAKMQLITPWTTLG